MVNLICGWCRGKFEYQAYSKGIKKGKVERNICICTNCNKILPSSKKEKIESNTGRGKHIHTEWQQGDIAR